MQLKSSFQEQQPRNEDYVYGAHVTHFKHRQDRTEKFRHNFNVLYDFFVAISMDKSIVCRKKKNGGSLSEFDSYTDSSYWWLNEAMSSLALLQFILKHLPLASCSLLETRKGYYLKQLYSFRLLPFENYECIRFN